MGKRRKGRKKRRNVPSVRTRIRRKIPVYRDYIKFRGKQRHTIPIVKDYVKIGYLLSPKTQLRNLIRRNIQHGFKRIKDRARREDPRETLRKRQQWFERQARRRDRMLERIAIKERNFRKTKAFPVAYDSKSNNKVRDICRERSRVRKTLFAENKIGKGKKISDKKRYNDDSNVRC